MTSDESIASASGDADLVQLLGTESVAAAPVLTLFEHHRRRCYCCRIAGDASGSREVVQLSSSELWLLSQCASFAPLEEHLRRVIGVHQHATRQSERRGIHRLLGDLPLIGILIEALAGRASLRAVEKRSQVLRSQLAALADKGLFLTRAEVSAVLERLCEMPSPLRPVSAICVPTKNRRQALATCLEGVKAEMTDPGLRCVVAMSGADVETRQEGEWQRGALWQLTRNSRERLIQFLGRHGADPGTARFAVDGWDNLPIDIGANRNAVLLATAGERIISVDDDVVISPLLNAGGSSNVWSLKRSDGVFTRSRPQDPRDIYFGGSAVELCGQLKHSGTTLTEVISGVLGRSLGDLASSRKGLDVNDGFSPAALAPALAHGVPPRTVAVLPGVVGDSGVGSPVGMMLLGTPSRDRLLRTRQIYQNAIRNRLCLRCVDAPAISLGDFFMTTCYGYDNTHIGVPFSPNFRSEDTLFGAMLRLTSPDFCILYLPQVVRHSPRELRSFRPRDARQPISVGMCWMIGALIHMSTPGTYTAGGEAWLAYVSEFLRAVAVSPPMHFLELTYYLVFTHWMKTYAHIEEILDQPSLPTWYRRDLKALQMNIRAWLRRPSRVVPGDLMAAGGDGNPEVAQRYVADFAGLLGAWPTMWRACAALSVAERGAMLGLEKGYN